MQHKYHMVYETTNAINGHKYRGVHSTNDLNSRYMGSGTALLKALKFFGKENFYRRTISMHSTREDAFEAEKDLVNQTWVNKRNTYNATTGGGGSYRKNITQARLKELFSYNPHKGVFVWTKSGKGITKGSVAGCKLSSGYVQIRVDGEKYSAHRLAWLYMTGEHPLDFIDHINGVRSDNRICNLRSCTAKENSNYKLATYNSSKGAKRIRKTNTGIQGIHKWSPTFTNKGKKRTYTYYNVSINENGKRLSKNFPYTPEGLESAKLFYEENYNRIHERDKKEIKDQRKPLIEVDVDVVGDVEIDG